MNGATTDSNDVCERALEYVYGELDDERKRAFEEHLAGCARCQKEVASLGRVRAAAKRGLPVVEPPASLAGALHAQLMHAAAQHKPRRGVLLAFPRKIAEHPALSAAAMFVLVGGAIAINWSRGKMDMPAAEQSSGKVAADKIAADRVAGEKLAESPMTATAERRDVERANEPKIGLATPSGNYTVERPAAHHATATRVALAKKEAAPRMKTVAADGKQDEADGLVGQLASDDQGDGALRGGKSSAPRTLRRGGALQEGAVREEGGMGGYAGAAPATTRQAPATMSQAPATMPQAAPPPPPAPAAAASRGAGRGTSANERVDVYQAQSEALPKPATKAPAFDLMRKNADEAAKSGRCQEAIRLYQALERAAQPISSSERARWTRCTLLQKAGKRLDDARVSDKKAKKAAPVERAPAQAQQQPQQRAAEPPSQAPASTSPKADKASPAY